MSRRPDEFAYAFVNIAKRLGALAEFCVTVLEIFANAITGISIWLAARNSVHTWLTGIVGCSLFALVFVRNQLYADATLQAFFIATSVLGWWQWHKPTGAAHERNVTNIRAASVAYIAAAAVGVTAAYGYLLHRFTNAYSPYVDSAVLALSVIAQCLLVQRKLETWPVWLAVNTISVGLFAARGLLLTAVLYAAYWINAWYGWTRWKAVAAGQLTATLPA